MPAFLQYPQYRNWFKGMSQEVTQLLRDWSSGNQDALEKLISLVYEELHRIASSKLQHHHHNQSLQATALVNEVYLRLIDAQSVNWQSRAHFFGVAAQLMRNILVDHVRSQVAAKRGGGQFKISLDSAPDVSDQKDLELIALDDALKDLEKIDPLQSRIVELRFFGGLSGEETAEVLGISTATISREWKLAKVWLLRQLNMDSQQ
jgi:RNA polymerase sigma factor (TIGR02999 family)